MDIKARHRYLISESLSAYERPAPMAAALENRTRLYRNAVAAARSVKLPGLSGYFPGSMSMTVWPTPGASACAPAAVRRRIWRSRLSWCGICMRRNAVA